MSNQADLIVKDLHVVVEKNEILKGLNLTVPQGEVHALMGPNGSGKSTLAYTLMGHPNYTVTGGEVIFKGQNILDLESEERARLGLFLAFQYPTAITGVTMFNFLRTAVKAIHGDSITPTQFRKQIREKMALLKMDDSFMRRYLNDGFSGGEKKRAEILQLALLRPEFAIMDETDSGLDIDALRTVAQGVSSLADGRMGGTNHYPLSAYPQLHKAGARAHHGRWGDSRVRRRRASGSTRATRLRKVGRQHSISCQRSMK